ncbi:arginine--tRNA ligase [Halorutilales archaeon Cl-col2-1]
MFTQFRKQVEESLSESLDSAGYSTEDLSLEKPPEDVDAGLASAVAFSLAGDENPAEVAHEIAANLHIGEYGLIGGASVKGPYINFSVSDDYLERTVEEATSDDYPALPDKDEKIILEHTSANPTGPLHVGRARNPIIGDSIARLLRKAGYDLDVEYYVNDMGRQVATIAWAYDRIDESELPEKERDKPDHDIVRYYRKANEILEAEAEGEVEYNPNGETTAEDEIDELLSELENGNEDALELVEEAVEYCLEGQRQSLERIGASYDRFVHESQFVLEGDVDDVSKRLKEDERSYEEEDARKIDLSDFDIDKELVFERSDGTSLYTTRDIAYHIDKFERSDDAVNVLGEDHKLQAEQLGAALEILGEDRKPRNVFYSYVSLPEGKMSTREGTVVNMDDLLDEAVERAKDEIQERSDERRRDVKELDETAEKIGIGAVRFDIVGRQAQKPITFRWEDALNFEGQHAPYIQYVHARASGILEQADADPEVDLDVDLLEDDEERALIEKIGELSDVVENSAESLEPHRIATYSRELAEAFNEFYRECRVLDVEDDLKKARLGLVLASKNAISNSLDLIGVEAPEAM